MRLVLPHELSDSVDWTQPIDWSHPLNRGLVAWWLVVPGRMGYGSATWRDLCGKYHGTLTGMDPKTDWGGARARPGGWGSLDFSTAATEYVAHSRIAELTGVAGFTVASWIRFPSSPAANDSYWGEWDFPTATVQQFARYSSGLQWFVRNSANSAEANATIPTANLRLGDWNFIVCVADGSNLRVYSGGVQRASTALTGPYIPSDSADWRIGWGRTGGGVHRQDGHAYWNRPLSATEVSVLTRLAHRHYDGMLNRISLPFGAEEQAGGGANRRRRILCGAAA